MTGGNDAGMLQSVNPATLEVNAEIQSATPEDVARAVRDAREAQGDWAATPVAQRGKILLGVKQYVLDHADEIARTITIDNGKTLLEALNSEIYPVLDMLTFCAHEAPAALSAERLKNPVFTLARIESKNIFEPLGVVGIISPWNFPFAIPMTQIAMALVAGNTVVLKPAEITPLVGDHIARVFRESGIPGGLVSVVQGDGAVAGEALMAARPDKIVFTGSVRVGKHLMARAAENLTPITLELGGKDPFIVMDDADIDRASSGAVWGAFINAGQVCASVERVYVHESVADEFINKVVEKTKKIRVGNGLEPDVDMGPLTSQRQLELVESHIADAVANGAEIAAGGGRPAGLKGWFHEPTVLLNVNHGMKCVAEETFGPTMPVMVYSDIDEAVGMANDSRYGLTASVWSRNTAKAEKVCRRIRAGVTVVNNCLLTYGFAQAPWGGVKDSGIGVTHSVHGLLEFTNIKNITTNKGLLKEDLWWYPYSDSKYNGMKAAMKTMFCEGMMCKTEGVLDLLKSFKLLKRQ